MTGETLEDADSESVMTTAVIVACIIGIVIVAALIVASPRKSETFTQLWLKPWKLNLTNASNSDEFAGWISGEGYNLSPILKVTFMGTEFYSFLRYSKATGAPTPVVWIPESGPKRQGSTIGLPANSLFLDAIDLEGGEILFYEYPRQIGPDHVIRFSFVVVNEEGEDHDYTAEVSLVSPERNATKLIRSFTVAEDAQMTCTVEFPLTADEAASLRTGNYTKVSVRLDTEEEVFFWIGST